MKRWFDGLLVVVGVCLVTLVTSVGPIGPTAWGQSSKPTKKEHDPLKNFDFVWKIFHKRYAFFQLYGIDWKESRQKFRKKLSHKSSPQVLYKVLRQMIDQMRDSHVTLVAPKEVTKDFKPEFRPNLYPFDQLRNTGTKVAKHHVRKLYSYDKHKAHWGMLKGAPYGYIQLNTLDGMKQCKELTRLTPSFSCTKKTTEEEATRVLMRRIMKDLKEAKAFVLDLRFNTGGFDSVSRCVVSYFIDKPYKAYSKRTKRAKGLSKEKSYTIKPAKEAKKAQLIMLMSHVTASAAEVLLLSTLPLSYATHMGSRTRGTFSDKFNATLPNGWKLSLSHQRYKDYNGKNHEGAGVTPHARMPYPIRQPKQLFAAFVDLLKKKKDAITLAKKRLK